MNDAQNPLFKGWVFGIAIHDISRGAFSGAFPIGAIYIVQQANNIVVRDNVLQNLVGGITPVYQQTCCGGVSNITISNKEGINSGGFRD